MSAGFAEDIPESDIDTADGMSYRATATLPEGGLVECFGDAFRLVGGLTFEEWPEQFEGALDKSSGGEAAAAAADALIGVNNQQGVEIFLRFVSLRPAAIDGGTGERADVNADNLHAEISESGF